MQSRILALDVLIKTFPATPPGVLTTALDFGIMLAIRSVHQIADHAAAEGLSGPIGPAIRVTATRLGSLLHEDSHREMDRQPIGWWRGAEA